MLEESDTKSYLAYWKNDELRSTSSSAGAVDILSWNKINDKRSRPLGRHHDLTYRAEVMSHYIVDVTVQAGVDYQADRRPLLCALATKSRR